MKSFLISFFICIFISPIFSEDWLVRETTNDSNSTYIIHINEETDGEEVKITYIMPEETEIIYINNLVAFFLRDLIIILNLRKIFHKYFLQNILVV